MLFRSCKDKKEQLMLYLDHELDPEVKKIFEEHLKEWLTVDKDLDQFNAFLKRNIFDCKDQEDNIAVNGGSKKMRELRAKEIVL